MLRMGSTCVKSVVAVVFLFVPVMILRNRGATRPKLQVNAIPLEMVSALFMRTRLVS